MSSIIGNKIKVSIFGQSHSEAIGVTIDGLPAGFMIDMQKLKEFLKRRAPGNSQYSTTRKEDDEPVIISGIVDGITCGAPLTAIIFNKNQHSSDYSNLADSPRPSHADYSAEIKYKGFQDIRGGGHFSGRLTAPLCVAGGICMQLLEARGITLTAYIKSIGTVFDDTNIISENDINRLNIMSFPVANEQYSEQMKSLIDTARESGDSVGGTIECTAFGVPAGIGEPMFDGMENKISQIIFGIPAIKGIEFGNGFEASKLTGSQNNDEFFIDNGLVKTKTNNHGGILGGITSGMPLVFRVAVKPTPSIAKPQNSISFSKNEKTKLTIHGRHDPCIVPRAVPCVMSAAAIAILDMLED